MFVSFVSTCFTVMLGCFIWFRRFMFFGALSWVVYVAFDRFKVFLFSVVLDPSEGCVGGSSSSNLFYVVFVCFRSFRLF